VVVLIDRKEVFRKKVGGEADRAFVDRGGGAPAGAKLMERFATIPVQVTAGVHEVVVTFHRALACGNRRPDCGRHPV